MVGNESCNSIRSRSNNPKESRQKASTSASETRFINYPNFEPIQSFRDEDHFEYQTYYQDHRIFIKYLHLPTHPDCAEALEELRKHGRPRHEPQSLISIDPDATADWTEPHGEQLSPR